MPATNTAPTADLSAHFAAFCDTKGTTMMTASKKPTAAQIAAYRTLMSARVVTQSDLNREKTRTAALKASLAKRGLTMADMAGIEM